MYIFENLDTENIRKQILNETKGLSGIYMIVNKITKDYYIDSAPTNRFYARFSNHLIYFRGAMWIVTSPLCLKLPNSGDTLKLLVPNCIWKDISGSANHWCMVTIQKMIKREIGYHGSKSDSRGEFVKEQWVDGSWYFRRYCDKTSNWSNKINREYLRYTLKGFERNYQIRIPSKQINKRFYSSERILPETTPLNPWFITGFTDAEGFFTLSIVKDSRSKTGWGVKFSFQIGLHNKERALLEQIKLYFNSGNISKHGSMLHFRVESIKDLAKVINHFDNYPLMTKKNADYELFKKAYYILLNKEHLIKEGLEKFVGIKASINKGLSDSLKAAFPNVAAHRKIHGNRL